jgi:hypothetical protein
MDVGPQGRYWGRLKAAAADDNESRKERKQAVDGQSLVHFLLPSKPVTSH